MGYFNGVAELHFKKDAQGRGVFYPLGALWKGFVLADAALEERARRFVKLHLGVSLVTIVIFMQLGWAWFIGAMLLLMAWFYFKVRSLLAGCPASGEKLSLAESYRNSAREHNTPMLGLMLAIGLGFTAGSFWLAAKEPGFAAKVPLAASGLFFGSVSFAIGYMLKVKSAAARGSGRR